MSGKKNFPGNLTRRTVLKYGLYGSVAAGLQSSLWISGCTKWSRHKGPNIILITLDTVRADHLSCYDYHRKTTPNLDKLARQSVLYTKAIAPSSWTFPSHASLFTGKFTSSHGAKYDRKGQLRITDAIRGPKSWQMYRARSLAEDELTLAQILKEAQYTTGAVVGGPWLKRVFGLDKGFEHYDDAQISTVNGRLASQMTAGALEWLEKVKKKPFFLFLNYFDAHGPYMPPKEFATAFLPNLMQRKPGKITTKEKIALYDAEILYMDHYIGKFLEKLKADGLYDNTMIIVTSDHGELLGEHGEVGHGEFLYQPELHIPLFVKYPAVEVTPARTDAPVQLNDVFVMILNRLGIEIPRNIQAGLPPQIGHPLVAETYPLAPLAPKGHWRAIFEDNYKFIWNSKNNHLLFDLEKDPGEETNLVAKQPQRAAKMLSGLNQYLAKLPAPGAAGPARELDEQTKEALRSLGYVK